MYIFLSDLHLNPTSINCFASVCCAVYLRGLNFIQEGLKSDREEHANVNQDLVQCATIVPGRGEGKKMRQRIHKVHISLHCAVCLRLRGVYKLQEGAEI